MAILSDRVLTPTELRVIDPVRSAGRDPAGRSCPAVGATGWMVALFAPSEP